MLKPHCLPMHAQTALFADACSNRIVCRCMLKLHASSMMPIWKYPLVSPLLQKLPPVLYQTVGAAVSLPLLSINKEIAGHAVRSY